MAARNDDGPEGLDFSDIAVRSPPGYGRRRTLGYRLGAAAKRAFDLVAAGTALLVLSPFLLVVAVAIKLDSPGPVLYRAPRVGRHGRRMTMYKFRTMVVDAERLGGTSTGENDRRITRVGGRLRAYKIDEVPQLLNVVRGNMSIVGPRPEVDEYTVLYTPEEMEILEVTPGMTDLASMRFHNLNAILARTPDVDRFYRDVIRPQKNKLRLEYARSRTFRGDLRIIFRTIRLVFWKR